MTILDQVILVALAVPFGISVIACAINLQLALDRTRYNKYLLMLLGPLFLLFPACFDSEGNKYRKKVICSATVAMICGFLAWLHFLLRADR